jgi:aspartate-semialdehyde dehydrogenase
VKDRKILVVGATGCVGREILSLLLPSKKSTLGCGSSEETTIMNGLMEDPRNITAVASEKSAGRCIEVNGHQIKISSINEIDFKEFSLAFFSAGSKVSELYAEKLSANGCFVIDNTSYFRMREDIPLIVPEVNFEDIKKYKNKYLISNPNCSTIQMVMVLKPLHTIFTLKEIVVSTYQSASGIGQKGIKELIEQTNSKISTPKYFPKRLAFNVIQQIDEFTETLYTKEEMKMITETKKILSLEDIEITATCVRVPVLRGHSESLFMRFEKQVDLELARETLSKFPGLNVCAQNEYKTPLEIASTNDVYVSRIRGHTSIHNAISCFVVADNVLRGAALNAVRIAEMLLESGLLH